GPLLATLALADPRPGTAACPHPAQPVTTKRALCRQLCPAVTDAVCAPLTGRERRRCGRGITSICVRTDPTGGPPDPAPPGPAAHRGVLARPAPPDRPASSDCLDCLAPRVRLGRPARRACPVQRAPRARQDSAAAAWCP